MFDFERKKIKDTLGDVYDMLKENKCVLAGGAITSLFTNKEINDYDLYFTTQSSVGNVMSEVYGFNEEGFLSSHDLIMCHATDRSFLTQDRSQVKVQFIHYKIHPNIDSIFQSFDFTACMGAYDFATEEFMFHPDFFKANAQRSLEFNKGTDFPIVSLLRVDKYKNKGYTISKAQMLRIAFTIVSKEYNDWDTVISEVSGLYGVKPEDIFDTTKPFSIDAVIDALVGVQLKEKPSIVHTVKELGKVVEIMRGSLSPHFKEWWDGLVKEDDHEKSIWYTPSREDIAYRVKYLPEEQKADSYDEIWNKGV